MQTGRHARLRRVAARSIGTSASRFPSLFDVGRELSRATTHVDAREGVLSDAGSTPAASTIYLLLSAGVADLYIFRLHSRGIARVDRPVDLGRYWNRSLALMNRLLIFTSILCFSLGSDAAAQERSAISENAPATTMFAQHGTDRIWLSGQMNVIFQTHAPFPAEYSGDHSLRPTSERATSVLMTLFTGIKVAQHTEVLFDIESAGGRGISDALGLAGFTDLDVVRNPELGAAPYVARVMLHETIALASGRSNAERSPLSLAKTVPTRRLEIRVGKFGTVDFFDLNAVGSDSHLQFMNWTVDNNGAYDYAADTRGYTWGAVVEYHDPQRVIRFGEMLMPKVANGLALDWNLSRARAENIEFEWHPEIGDRSGIMRLLAYVNHANMGDYREAVHRFVSGVDPVPTIENTRQQGRIKYGFGVNVEQPVTAALRAFARGGWNEPHFESFAYTEANDSAQFGVDYAGARWKRPTDKIGGAFVTNGLSDDHERYLALGGLGFLLGDGGLRPGREQIFEGYYTTHLWRGLFVSADAQHVTNPGYNRDRGPVLVASARLHVDF
jgi:high affinity Mn2+ porin